jgi:hypothetical protein
MKVENVTLTIWGRAVREAFEQTPLNQYRPLVLIQKRLLKWAKDHKIENDVRITVDYKYFANIYLPQGKSFSVQINNKKSLC